MSMNIDDNFIVKEFVTKYGLNKNKLRASWLEKHKDVKDYLDNRFSEIKDKQLSYNTIIHYIINRGVTKCKMCGKIINWERTYCSVKCRAHDREYWEKFNKSMEKIYGSKWAMQSEKIKKKFSDSIEEKYGTKWYVQTNEFKEKSKDKRVKTFETKYGKGITCSFSAPNVKEKIKKTVRERYGVDYPCLLKQCTNGHNKVDSAPNKKFKELLEKHKVSYESEFIIKKKSYDFLLKDYKILIEINPTITHNIDLSPYSKEKGISKTYHKEKTDLAEKQGYKCICVWDWMNPEEVIIGIIEGTYERKYVGMRQHWVSLKGKVENHLKKPRDFKEKLYVRVWDDGYEFLKF